MADIKWTDEQLEAITAHGNNILVSAAAGSGKTAVLVERVLRKITDPEHPVDIGSLLIITFTRAAAAQMKDKIFSRLRTEVKEHPENEFLKKQLQDVHCARIYTIDALCMEIVRDNFHAVDIDPGFSIADENESASLMADVLGNLIEEQYADPSPEFLKFVNFYIDKSDARLEEIILRMYRYAQSHPEPEVWIKESVIPYAAAADMDCGEGSNSWLDGLKKEIDREIAAVREMAQTGLLISEYDHGPYKYAELFTDVLDKLNEIPDEDCMFDYRREEVMEILADWKRAPSIYAKDDVDPDLKDAAKELRDNIRKHLKYLAEHFFAKDLEEAYADMAGCADVAKVIADLTLSFSRRLLAERKEQGLFDFGDVAHFALEILLQHDEEGRILKDSEGNMLRSETAVHLSREISEIVVDEYQDTNLIQEYIINALSSESDGRPDVFMVGDVKQSIYGFRLACPELFIDKYNRYQVNADPADAGRKILLNANFRSRAEVLDLANYIFERAMIADVGGVEYTDGHALIAKASYPEAEDAEDVNPFAPEIIAVEGTGEDAKRTEAYEIAQRIEELISKGVVTAEDGTGFRPVRYSDIAILTRNSDNPGIEQMLEARNIPLIRSSNRGFFDTFEIRLIMDLLNVIDNPFQDIPLAAVLTSPAVGIDENDLARIRIFCGKDHAGLYEGIKRYAKECDDAAAGRLKEFLVSLDDYRRRACYMSVSDLIGFCMEQSGLNDIIAAMPRGEGRRANIDFLKNKALQGFKGQSGLFLFIRHVKQMQESDMDFGQAQVFTGDVDAVRMMTIHKSKGLEFPVVFVARAGSDYNQTDIRANIIPDRNMGLGLELRDPLERTVQPTLLLETIRAARKRELYAEEMRLLYVAMTRAKEKLFITGQVRGYDKASAQWKREWLGMPERGHLSAPAIMDSSCFLKLLGRTIADGNEYDIGVTEVIESEEERAEEIFDRDAFLYGINNYLDGVKEGRPGAHSAIGAEEPGSILSWNYPYDEAVRMPVKITASQMEDHSAGAQGEDEPVWPRPYARKESKGLSGAERGNAYHRLFELLEYERFSCGPDGGQAEGGPAEGISAHSGVINVTEESTEKVAEAVRDMISDLRAKGLLDGSYADAVDPFKIAEFLRSELGCRMIRAAHEGRLRREQQFVMGRTEGGEQTLVQGIIDAFFGEDGGIVLVDYKTDRNKTEEELIRTYKGQLEIYAKAIEAACGLNVSSMIIYSIELSRGIVL